MSLPDSAILDNLYVKGGRGNHDFEKAYILARRQEQRLYTDEEVRRLPHIGDTHVHASEWRQRGKSAAKLVRYLSAKKRPLRILEIGCGNGWLSFQLAGIRQSYVVAQDINFTEIQQAARVFNGRKRIRFMYGDAFTNIHDDQLFDVIVFAASIQYFSSLFRIIAFALDHLREAGEIHIIDTNFYAPSALAAARMRSKEHFRNIGCPDMAAYYFHHTRRDLDVFRFDLLHDPKSLTNRLMAGSVSFPWIRIRKK